MKKIISALLAIIMIISCFAMSFSASAEEGTSRSDAVAMTAGTYYTKAWTESNFKLDCFYKITIPSRGYITLTLEKLKDDNEVCSYELTLLDENGNNVWLCDTDDQTETSSAYFVYKVGLNAGTYYLNIAPYMYYFFSDEPIRTKYKYTFNATDSWEIEPNNTKETATQLTLDKMFSGVYTEESYSGTYEDYYKISLQKGLTYNIKIENFEELDDGTTIVTLIDPAGETDSLYDYKMSGNTAVFTFKPTTSGTHYIRFYNDGNDAGIDYKVGVSAVKKSISKMTVNLSAASFAYTGKEIKPTVSISGLKSGTDFTVTYSNNVDIGTAKVVVKGTGGYKDSITKTFNIVPANVSVSSATPGEKDVTIKWAKHTAQTTGFEIQYSTKSDFSSAKSVKVTSNTAVSKKITSLTTGVKYYFRVRAYKTVGDKTFNSAWSKAVSAKTIKRLTISKTKATLYVGGSLTIKAVTEPTDKKVTWKSSDTKVAKVSSSGKVTPVKAGKATITASVKIGSKTYKETCELTVATPSVKLNKSTANVYTKESITLKATVKPTDAKVTWKSSDTKIAKVSSSGKVTGVKTGTVTITASIKYGSKTYKATCKVTVKKNPYNTGKSPALSGYINNHRTSNNLILCVPVTITNNGNENLVFGGVQGFVMSKEFTCLGYLWPERHTYQGDRLYGPGKIKEMSGNTITIKPGKTVTFYMALKESMYVLDSSYVLLNTTYKGTRYAITIRPDGSGMIINRDE